MTTETDDEAVRKAASLLKRLGWSVAPPRAEKWGCHVDLFTLPEGAQPDGCVIDDGVRSACIYANDIERKEQCEYWQRITPESIRKARGE